MSGMIRIFAFALVVLGTSASFAQIADPPGTAAVMGQYRAWFAATDTSKDGMLDKEELARRFRGQTAKPFDYVPPSREKPDDNKGESEKPTGPKPAPKANYSLYADYNFLVQFDKNNDEQVSREEFEAWARDIALQLKNQLEAQNRVLQLQQKLQTIPNKPNQNANERKKHEEERKRIAARLKKEREENERLKDRLERAQKNIKQAQQKAKQQKPPQKKPAPRKKR